MSACAITWRPMSEHPTSPVATAMIRCTDDQAGPHLLAGPVRWSISWQGWISEDTARPVKCTDPDAIYHWCHEAEIVGAGGTAKAAAP